MKAVLKIIYQDDFLIAINKPHGLLVHKSGYASNANVFAVQELRNQIGQKVFPCHRLDRKTSGVLLFALDEDTNSKVQQQFASNSIQKKYLAIVRGFTDDKGTIDYSLTNDKGKTQNAITKYKTINQSEVNIPFGKFDTSRYSLVEAYPQTGRYHQIRKHFAHIMHPIIGDRPHGCNKQNKLFKEEFNMTTMMLHASEISFTHPHKNLTIMIQADLQDEFKRTKIILGL
jgi:tRNA pseudouridine65 synthase